MDPEGVIIRIADARDEQFAEQISAETERSTIERGALKKKVPGNEDY